MTARRAIRPVPLNLSPIDEQYCSHAVEIYCKRLEDLKEKAETLGRAREAAEAERDIGGLREELVEPLRNHNAQILPHHLAVIKTALGMLSKNLLAARGTLKPLPDTETWIEDLTAKAAYVDGQLLPKFDEQGTLDIAPHLTDDAGKGLKELADAEGED